MGNEVSKKAQSSIEELEYIAGHHTTPIVVAQAAQRAKDVIRALMRTAA
jgi:hypothetical protein